MAEHNSSPLTLGDVMITQNALTVLDEAGVEPKQLISRHAVGDWGDVDEASRAANDLAAQTENHAASAYFVLGNVYVVIAMHPEPNQTIVGLPDEMRQLQGGDDG